MKSACSTGSSNGASNRRYRSPESSEFRPLETNRVAPLDRPLPARGPAGRRRPRISVESGPGPRSSRGNRSSIASSVDNVENPKTPELRGDWTISTSPSWDSGPLDSQQITIINGVMQQVVHRGREFRYRLTPKKTGQLTIPAPETRGRWQDPHAAGGTVGRAAAQCPGPGGRRACGRSPGGVSHATVHRDLVGLRQGTARLPLSDRDPLSVQRPPPVLRIPWLTDQDLPGGRRQKRTGEHGPSSFIDREGVGFGINELVRQTAFSFFGDNDALAFRPKPTIGPTAATPKGRRRRTTATISRGPSRPSRSARSSLPPSRLQGTFWHEACRRRGTAGRQGDLRRLETAGDRW